MNETVIELDPRRRTTVRAGQHSRYLVTVEPDGTLIWKPAIVITEDEKALLSAPWLVEQIAQTQANPSLRTRRPLPIVKD